MFAPPARTLMLSGCGARLAGVAFSSAPGPPTRSPPRDSANRACAKIRGERAQGIFPRTAVPAILTSYTKGANSG